MRFGTIAGVLLLAGCAGVQQRSPTMGADPPLTGGESAALVNELQSVLVPIGESCLRPKPQHQDGQTWALFKYSGDDRKYPHQFECVTYRTPAGTEVKDHVEAGYALADIYCDDFFRRISLHASERRFSRGVVNDVGAAISAALGLAKAGGAVTGGIGAGFGLADGTLRNYDDAFLISADLSTLQARVYSEQDKMRNDWAPRVAKMTRFSEANTAILRYANLCSYTGMRQLVNASLTQATTPADSLTAMAAAVKAYIAGAAAIRTAVAAAPDTGDNSSEGGGNAVDVNQM